MHATLRRPRIRAATSYRFRPLLARASAPRVHQALSDCDKELSRAQVRSTAYARQSYLLHTTWYPFTGMSYSVCMLPSTANRLRGANNLYLLRSKRGAALLSLVSLALRCRALLTPFSRCFDSEGHCSIDGMGATCKAGVTWFVREALARFRNAVTQFNTNGQPALKINRSGRSSKQIRCVSLQ